MAAGPYGGDPASGLVRSSSFQRTFTTNIVIPLGSTQLNRLPSTTLGVAITLKAAEIASLRRAASPWRRWACSSIW